MTLVVNEASENITGHMNHQRLAVSPAPSQQQSQINLQLQPLNNSESYDSSVPLNKRFRLSGGNENNWSGSGS